MSSKPELFAGEPMLSPDRDDGAEVVANSPVVQRFFTAVLALLIVLLAVTLTSSIVGSIRGADEAVAEEVALVVTTTTLPAPDTSVLPSPVSTTEPATSTSQPKEASAVFAQFPTSAQLVLWTYNERQVFLVDVDAGTSSELDLTELGVPLVESIIGVGDRLVVRSLGDFYAIDVAGAASLRLEVRGVVQVFGDDEIWLTDSFVGDAPTSPIRIDVLGERRELPEIPADSFPFGYVDDRLLVGAGRSGGIYLESDDQYEFVSDGELVASGGGFILARTCDASLKCSLARIELATGTSTLHEPPPGFSLKALWWIDEAISPQVDAVLGLSNDLGGPAIWDLLTDEVTPLAIGQGRGATWSPDGAWLFVSIADQVIAFHRGTLTEVVVPVPAGVGFSGALQLAMLPASSDR